MGVDEELDQLADSLRRLKIEYETYFNGGSPRPPNVLIFRVERIINRHNSGASDMSLRQRYRLNQLAQSYFAYKDLWRRKLKLREQGIAAHRQEPPAPGAPFSMIWSGPDGGQNIHQLLQAAVCAFSQAGAAAPVFDAERFAEFARRRVRQFKQSLECDALRLTVCVDQGRVKLRAAKAETGSQ